MVIWTISFEKSFLFIILERIKEWDGKEMGVHLKILTKWKHKQTLSLGSCLLKMHLSFFKYWLGPLSGFYHGEFYSDAELM